MHTSRRCSRSACNRPAVATLTYAYADSTAVLGPLALRAEPGCYDLCRDHSQAMSVPRGWEVIRLPMDAQQTVSDDDLVALAEAVREAAFTYDAPAVPAGLPAGVVELGHRGHLTVLADAQQARRR